MNKQLIKLVKTKKYYEDLYQVPWMHCEDLISHGSRIQNKKKLRIGIINVPCGGFGDIIVCQTFYEYLKQWYPEHDIILCTTTPYKFKKLGINTKGYVKIHVHGDDECELYNYLYFKKQPKKFDIMICIPIINYAFNINQFKQFIPYATLFNTFTMSEYNGYIPPYTFPIGVGKGQLGLFLSNQTIPKHNLINRPYALIYIQPSPEWGVHSKTCFISFMEMIATKYHKKHSFFQVVVQQWIIDSLNESPQLKHRLKQVIHQYYPNVWIHSNDSKDTFFQGQGNSLIIRGDILPKPRPEFISLMKYSVEDILLTGDQSITDCLSNCSNKHIWYQIAPWKTDFAKGLALAIPDKNIENFRTTCGNLQGLRQHKDYKELLKHYDFRKLGKIRMNSILDFTYNKHKFKDYMDIVEHSRTIQSVVKKLEKLKYKVN
jgi:hypothetical protein